MQRRAETLQSTCILCGPKYQKELFWLPTKLQESLDRSRQVRAVPVTPRGYKWALTGTRILDWALLTQWQMQLVRVLLKKKKPKKRKHNTARHHLKIKKNKKHREDWSCVDSSGKFYTCTPPRATPQSKMPSTLSFAQIPSQYVTTKGNHSLTSDIINQS